MVSIKTSESGLVYCFRIKNRVLKKGSRVTQYFKDKIFLKKNGARHGDLILAFYYYCSRTSFQKLAFYLKSKKFLKVCQWLISSSYTLGIPDDTTFFSQ